MAAHKMQCGAPLEQTNCGFDTTIVVGKEYDFILKEE